MRLYDIVFSPTGGTKKVSALLTGALEGEAALVDLTGSKQDFHAVQLTQEDVAVIAVPSYGGRVPAVAVERLTRVNGQGARAILVCVYGNRAYEDTLVELEDAAKQAGFRVIAAVAAVATHSSFLILPSRFRLSSLRKTARSLRFPETALTKRPEVPAWCPSPQRRVPNAAYARRNVPCRPSARIIRKGWMRRCASPVCAASPFVLTPPEKSILSCSPPSVWR